MSILYSFIPIIITAPHLWKEEKKKSWKQLFREGHFFPLLLSVLDLISNKSTVLWHLMGEEQLLKYMRRKVWCPSRTHVVCKSHVPTQQGWFLLAEVSTAVLLLFNLASHPHWSGLITCVEVCRIVAVTGGGKLIFISLRSVWIQLVCSIHLTVATVSKFFLKNSADWVSSLHELAQREH